MGQIVGGAAKPKRCNLNKLSQLETPAAGEHILVSSDNSMNAAGQGNFDAYVVGNGRDAATALPLYYITPHIVNNLTTGGVDNVLSAEQGKILKNELDTRTLDSVTESMTHEEVLQQEIALTSYVYKATPDSIGKTLSELAKGLISSSNTYKIEISDYIKIKFRKFISSQGWGSLITDENNIVLGAYTFTDETVPYEEIPVMEGAKYFYYACLKSVGATEWTFEGTNGTDKIEKLSQQIEFLSEDKIPYNDIYDGLDSEDPTKVLSAKQGKVLHDELYVYEEIETQATDYQKHFTGSAFKATDDVIGENITNVPNGTLSAIDTYKIPIDSYSKIEFLSFGSSQGWGSVVTNEEGVVLDAFNSTELGITYSYVVTEGAKYLYYGIYKNDISLYIIKGFKKASKINEIESKLNILPKEFSIQASNENSIKPYLFQGKVSNSSVVEDEQFVTTSPIFGNFYLKLNDEFRIYSSSLVDANGDIVTDLYLSNVWYNGDDEWLNRKNYGVYNMPSGYGVLVTFIKVDSNNNIMPISVSDCIIRKFEWLTDEKTPRLLPETDIQYYNAAWKRSRSLQKLVFTPLLKLPARGSLDGTFYIKDKTYVGIPYSGARFYEKFVGVDVAIRTFISSLYNLHSLMYTENLRTNAHHSEYGFTYPNDGEASTYYGVVCSAFVAYVLGKGIVIPSNTPTVLGLTKVTNYTSISDVRPLDVIVTYGHISIITDILKDSKGNPKYICWAEATPPLTKITPYTFEDFMERFNLEKGENWASSGFYRYNNWADNISLEVEDTTNLVEVENDDYVYGRKFNDDICTFAGDYSAFLEGQTIFLNVKPKDIYTKVIIRKENAADIEIDITSATIVDGIADIDITNLSLTDGIYTAFLQNSDGTVSSEPTHFEVLRATINATSSGGSSYNITFDYGSGVPYAVCGIDSGGVVYTYKKLTDAEISDKACSLASSRTIFRLYVKGEYGVICNQVTAS